MSGINFSNIFVWIVNFIIVFYIGMEVIIGYKNGFFEKKIEFLIYFLIFIVSYLLREPLTLFLCNHLPFFRFDGLFRGVSSLNILVYDTISFLLIFTILSIIACVILRITNLTDKIVSLIHFFGLPNKILGALVGLIKSLIFLYFFVFLLFCFGNLLDYNMKDSFANKIIKTPILDNVFGNSVYSWIEITDNALDFEDTSDKNELDKNVCVILLKYNIISNDDLQLLVDNDKIYGS